jgi:hypothetical protein
VSGAEYDAWLIRIGEGDQFSSGFVEVNPNSKIPALSDHSTTRRRAYLSPAAFCFISLKNLVSSCLKIPQGGPKP